MVPVLVAIMVTIEEIMVLVEKIMVLSILMVYTDNTAVKTGGDSYGGCSSLSDGYLCWGGGGGQDRLFELVTTAKGSYWWQLKEIYFNSWYLPGIAAKELQGISLLRSSYWWELLRRSYR